MFHNHKNKHMVLYIWLNWEMKRTDESQEFIGSFSRHLGLSTRLGWVGLCSWKFLRRFEWSGQDFLLCKPTVMLCFWNVHNPGLVFYLCIEISVGINLKIISKLAWVGSQLDTRFYLSRLQCQVRTELDVLIGLEITHP